MFVEEYVVGPFHAAAATTARESHQSLSSPVALWSHNMAAFDDVATGKR